MLSLFMNRRFRVGNQRLLVYGESVSLAMKGKLFVGTETVAVPSYTISGPGTMQAFEGESGVGSCGCSWDHFHILVVAF